MTIAVIGAGLSGLYAAWRLHQMKQDVRLFEARDRIGGRILSVTSSNSDGSFDLGPTWFWPDHQHRLPNLLNKLGIEAFQQFTQGGMVFEPLDTPPQMIAPPAMGPPSYRISGGAVSLTKALSDQLPNSAVALNSAVTKINQTPTGVSISTNSTNHLATHVLVSLPPRLFASTVSTEPALPNSLLSSFNKTPTWMAAHAKLIAIYETPFWREHGLSGQAFSYRGPMMEIHDASPATDGPHGLFGFIGVEATRRRSNRDAIKRLAVEQLTRLFGEEAATPVEVLYKDWSEDPFTATAADEDAPKSHPIYFPPQLPESWQSKMTFIGTEAANENGGYLEGCLEAADAAIETLFG